MIRLNLGCGNDYKKNWVNVDFNKEIKSDIYADFTKKLPFKDNSVDFILLDNVLEHIPSEKYFSFLDELYRISKDKSLIRIFVPHYTSMYALKHPTHYKYFGINSFSLSDPSPVFNGERYSNSRFLVKEEKLLFFHHKMLNFKILSKLPINWLFNFSKIWKLIMERFQVWGFDEISYLLEVYKKKKDKN